MFNGISTYLFEVVELKRLRDLEVVLLQFIQ